MNARHLCLLAALAALPPVAIGCTVGESRPDPMRHDAGAHDASASDAGPRPDAGPRVCDPGSTIGAACTSTLECDDGCFCNGVELCMEGQCVQRDAPCADEFDCTADGCDEENDRCELVGRDEMCDDGDFCNGAEECVPGIGCRAGLRPSCNDGDPCTVGSCDPTEGCVFTVRDLDGDGYADDRCGGTDCNDDPLTGADISPGSTEVCGNGYDDDCDGLADYRDPSCGAVNDTCDTAEMLPGPGTYVRTTRGAANDYPLGCAPVGVDTVFRFELDAAADVNVSLTVETGAGSVAIRPASSCTTGPDTYCRAGEVLARDLQPGEYVIIVRTTTGTTFSMTFERLAPTPSQATDVCNESTFEISASGTYTGFFSDVNHDYTLACRNPTSTPYKDVAYRLVLTEPSDVRLTAETSATTEYLSLVRDCTSPETAIACVQRNTPEIFRRTLAPGVYYVLLETSSTTTPSWSLTADIQPAAMRNPGDACATAIDITDAMVDVPLGSIELDYGTSCGGGTSASRDASFSFTTTELSDVVIETEVGALHYVSVSTDCGELATEIACTSGTPRVAQRLLRVPPGTYYVTASTSLASGTLRASARIEPPTFAPANDTCAGAETFGDLTDGVAVAGNLIASSDDLQSCAAAGSPDTIHRLVLTERRNVTVVARRTDGSAEPLSVGLREACDATSDLVCGSGASALLNRTLDAGTHYLVVESSRGSVGPYSIVAYFADP